MPFPHRLDKKWEFSGEIWNRREAKVCSPGGGKEMRFRLLPTIIYGDCRYLRFCFLNKLSSTYEKNGEKRAKIVVGRL